MLKNITIKDFTLIDNTQLGSNPGGKWNDKNGQQYYIKFPSFDKNNHTSKENEIRAKNEVLAAKLFNKLCDSNEIKICAPEYDLIMGTLQSGKDKDKVVYGVASKWIKDIEEISKYSIETEISKTPESFALFYIANAWINNWDATQSSNVGFLDSNGEKKIIPMDFGGGLNCRANPQRNQSIFKTEFYGNPKAFNYKNKNKGSCLEL